MQKKLTALLLALVMLLSLLTGCGSTDAADTADTGDADSSTADTEETDSTDSAESDTDSTTLTEVPEEAREDPVAYLTDNAMASGDVVMTVNGVDVTSDTFVYWLAYQYTYAAYVYAQYGSTLDLTQTVNDDGTTIAQSLFAQSQAVVEMNALLRSRAEDAGLTLSDDQNSSLSDLEENYDDNTLLYYGTNMDTLKQAYSDSCLSTNLRDYLFSEDGEMAPTDETLSDYAEEQGTYTCRYILLSTSDLEEDDTDGKEAQRQAAEDLLTQLQECSADELESKFEELQGTSNYDGNTDRYTFDNDDSLVDGFREKVAELAVGELGMTDETDYGYFVLLRLDNDLEDLRDDYASATFDSLVDQWMDEAEMTSSDVVENFDVSGFYDRLIDLQGVLTEILSAESEESSDTTDTTDTAEDTADTDETADSGETGTADSDEPVG